MGVEIEARFLVFGAMALDGIKPDVIAQGYLSTDPDRTVRVRRRGDDGFLTVKGRKAGLSAPEFEYPVPAEDLPGLLALCGNRVLTKNRYHIAGPDGMAWEVDIFTGRHAGLRIAELELPDEETAFVKPDWLGPEITDDARFSNANLTGAEAAEIEQWLRDYR